MNILNPIFHKIAWNLAYITKHHGELIYDIMKDFDVSPIGKQFKFDYLCKKILQNRLKVVYVIYLGLRETL